MDAKSYNPLQSLVSLTNRVGRSLVQSIWEKVDDDEIDILPQHMGVLSDLWQQEGLRQQDLAVSAIKDKATITRTLNYLEENNFLVRVADPQDKRIKRIYLTHKGKNLKPKLIPYMKSAEKEATAGISEEELSVCKRVLYQIYQNLKSCRRNQ